MVDMPDLPPQYAQVMLVQASQSQQTKAKYDRTIGVCNLIENPAHPPVPSGLSALNYVGPIGDLKNYFRSQERRQIGDPSTVAVLENPKHGELKDMGTSERSEVTGMKIRLVYSFHVVKVVNQGTEELCPSPSFKRLSVSPGTDTDPLASQNPIQLTYLGGAINANVSLVDLAGGAVGQTTGGTTTSTPRPPVGLVYRPDALRQRGVHPEDDLVPTPKITHKLPNEP